MGNVVRPHSCRIERERLVNDGAKRFACSVLSFGNSVRKDVFHSEHERARSIAMGPRV